MFGRTIWKLSAVSVLVLCAVEAYATPIHYAESISGDLGAPSQTFALGIGNNTVSGTTSLFLRGANGCPYLCLDFDGFDFVIPTGQTLTDIDFSFTTAVFNASDARTSFVICRGAGGCAALPILGLQGVDLPADPSPNTFDFGGILPLGAGAYTFAQGSLGIDVEDPTSAAAGWSVDYELTFRVVPVPEPGTLGLLGAGLLAMFVRRRRNASL